MVVERLARVAATKECWTALSHAAPPTNTEEGSQESIAVALAQTSIGASTAEEPPEPVLQDFSPSSKSDSLDVIFHEGGGNPENPPPLRLPDKPSTTAQAGNNGTFSKPDDVVGSLQLVDKT